MARHGLAIADGEAHAQAGVERPGLRARPARRSWPACVRPAPPASPRRPRRGRRPRTRRRPGGPRGRRPRTEALSRRATSFNSSSPTAWPMVSLTVLKRSTSMKMSPRLRCCSRQSGELLVEPLHQVRAVGQPGEGVVAGRSMVRARSCSTARRRRPCRDQTPTPSRRAGRRGDAHAGHHHRQRSRRSRWTGRGPRARIPGCPGTALAASTVSRASPALWPTGRRPAAARARCRVRRSARRAADGYRGPVISRPARHTVGDPPERAAPQRLTSVSSNSRSSPFPPAVLRCERRAPCTAPNVSRQADEQAHLSGPQGGRGHP